MRWTRERALRVLLTTSTGHYWVKGRQRQTKEGLGTRLVFMNVTTFAK